MKQNTVTVTSTLAIRPTPSCVVSGFRTPPAAGLVATSKSRLISAGRTSHGHCRFLAASVTRPELFHDVLVSKDGTRVSCDCAACAFHRDADEHGRLTVKRSDVLAGRVVKCCWHLKRAARLAPLTAKGFGVKEVSA
jgi:hypothetical protein